MKRVWLIFVYLFFFQQSFPLFEFIMPTWGTKEEIAHIINNINTSSKQSTRYQKLQANKHKLYWHLKDPYIGIIFKVKHDQPLSWNFSLWDFCQQRGKGVSLAIFDQKLCQEGFSLERSFDCYKNSLNDERKNKDDELHSSKRDRLLSDEYEAVFLGHFLKNAHQFHGTSSINLIQQIAPNVEYVLFDIIDQNSAASSLELCNILQTIKKKQFDCLHFGFKLLSNHNQTSLNIEQYLSKIPYIVAASGNNPLEQEGYPARSLHVAFDVGAYDMHHDICNFSQFSKNSGPKFVAPGSDLLCQITNNVYMLTSGTSMAAAIITGFVALVLAEFQYCFNYQEILEILYLSATKLKNDSNWKFKSVLGAFDMRTTLLCFHTLKSIKCHISKQQFNKLFHKLLQGVLILNQSFKKESTLLKPIHDKFIRLAQERNLYLYVQLCTECILKIYNLKIKRHKFKDLFDNNTVCLLKNSIKQGEPIPYKGVSKQAKQKIQYVLNRKQ